MKLSVLLTACLLAGYSMGVLAQSTSPDPVPASQQARAPRAVLPNSSQVITFSEYALGTSITNQYKQIGIIFSSGAFISTDGSNPTSPVLSGTPRFEGPITGKFVIPGTDTPTYVKSFTFDAGYFNEFNSTRIEWFNLKGEKLGQRINSKLGIETFTIDGGNIASWTISIVANEPAGYAIDNVSFVPTGSSILFRENDDTGKEATWGVLADDIPGFDHVGFHIENKVYESHPPYIETGSAIYLSKDGKEKINIASIDGVQNQFTRSTFEHDSRSLTTTVVKFEEIPIDEELAKKMRSKIDPKLNTTIYGYIDFGFPFGLQRTLLPPIQKGSKGTFTCVGLVEWAAEESGHNNGQGFVPNIFESFYIVLSTIPVFEVPTLSPELLNYAMKSQQLLANAKQWVQGFFDPVDFIITDPLGRRLGFAQGVYYREIPYAFYPGDGKTEQFLIPQAIPGIYKIKLIGKGDNAFAAVGAKDASESFSGMLADGQVVEKTIVVKPTAGCLGDVNIDAVVDSRDITALAQKLNQFTNGLGAPGDLDGDGLLSNADLELLKKLVNAIATPVLTITPATTAVCSGAPVSLTATASGFTPTNYVWSSVPAGFSGAGASLTAFTQNAPIVSAGTPYTITVTAANGLSSVTTNAVVTVNALPMASLTNNGPFSCANNSIQLTASGGSTYRFSQGASQNGGPGGNTATVMQTGMYSVTAISQSGCTSVASTTVSGSSDLPMAPILTASALSTVNQPISVTAAGCAGTLNWSLAGGAGQANGTLYTLTTPGNYTLSATCTAQTCTSPATKLILSIGSVSPGGALAIVAPAYDCATGAITFKTSGGDGSLIEYFAIGITNWSTNPNQIVETGLRTDRKVIELKARQNGVMVSYIFDMPAFCAGGPVTPTPTALAMLMPTYNCSTGAITFQTSGGDGSLIEYYAIGITNWSANPNQIVDRELRADPKVIDLKARQNGVVVSYRFDLPALCPAVPITPSGPLALLAPAYNCATGAITFKTSGGNGSLIEYFAIGITNWSTNPNQIVETGLRMDRKILLLKARQSGMEVSYVFDMPAFCAGAGARLSSSEPGGLQVQVLGNPVEGKTAQIAITGATGQAVQLVLFDTQGRSLYQYRIEQAAASERVSVPTPSGVGLLLLHVSTDKERQLIKLLKQ